MDANLEQAVLDAVVTLWPTAGGSLASKTVYRHLCAQGVKVPDGAMVGVWMSLLKARQLNGALVSTPRASQTDGGLTITWVNPKLLET
jgi:hypothetical protein